MCPTHAYPLDDRLKKPLLMTASEEAALADPLTQHNAL